MSVPTETSSQSDLERAHRPFLQDSKRWLVFPWWSFLLLGVGTGFVVCSMVFDPSRMSVLAWTPFLPLSLLTGYATARVWWRVVHRQTWWRIGSGGLCIQGALLGALTIGVGGVVAIGDPPLYFLDALMPGLFVGMAIARVGCLCAGCCAGRPTESPWALWSYSGRAGERTADSPRWEQNRA
ncbi:MAG: prolipoprotein diacylglyceryl transferase [Acidimicrobiia bacterium]|nr:prolipoprotein diacylglyceryl transferase [Acidimicrobiia bacterium]